MSSQNFPNPHIQHASYDFTQDKQAQAQTYVQRAYAENTLISYQSDLRHLTRFFFDLEANEEISQEMLRTCLGEIEVPDLVNYLTTYAEQLNPKTLSRRLSAFSNAFKALNLVNLVEAIEVEKTIRGIKRLHGKPTHKHQPVLLEQLEQLIDSIDLSTHQGLRNRCLLILAYAGALRRSEVVNIRRSDIQWLPNGLILNVFGHKGDREGQGKKLAIPFAKNSKLCAIQATKEWLECIDNFEIKNDYLALRISKTDNILDKSISDHAFYNMLKKQLKIAGLDSKAFAPHSLRAGLITQAAIDGKPEHKIMAQSGHKNRTMLDEYIRDAHIFDNNAADFL